MNFRILSIDGGGIKGIFPASFLAQIEDKTGKRIVDHFDLIAGTSTGGIIALGLGLGFRAADILKFYREQGRIIFPRQTRISRVWGQLTQYFTVAYSSEPLERVLQNIFEHRRLGESICRLVVPAFDAVRGDVHIYKTSHNERLTTDFRTEAWQVALATASAPTYFPCFKTPNGSSLIDGGVWANNPAMVALTDALALLQIPSDQISMLSIGTTESPLSIGRLKRTRGGKLLWASTAVDLLMHGQSLAATKQASLILGRDRFLRVNPIVGPGIYGPDDVNAAEELIGYGESEARSLSSHIVEKFLQTPVQPFVPVHHLNCSDQKEN